MRLVMRALRLITFRDRQLRRILAPHRARTFKLALHCLLPKRVPLLANPDRVFAKLGAEGSLYKKQGLERGNVDIITRQS